MAASSTPPPDQKTYADAPRGEWGWTPRQRCLAGLFSAAVIVALIVGVYRMPADVDEPLLAKNGQPMTLPGRLDPNTASAAQLELVPHLSATLVENILVFREAHKNNAVGGAVFDGPDDLARVPGVTKSVLSQAAPYLEFPGDAADTEPMR